MMNTKLRALRNRSVLLGLLLTLVGLSFAGWRAIASQSSANDKTVSDQNGLASVLEPDGSLKPGINGSFNVSGYRMETAVNGIPRFVPAVQSGCNGWDTQFTLSNGVSSTVNALVVSGTDVYIGGDFTVSGNVTANRVVKFNTLNKAWSVLGTSGGNGVNGPVFALAVSGSDLYVGGAFTTANLGGATVNVNNVAKFNTTSGVWSALGVGGGNGVDNYVIALTVSGSDLYVGGGFATANVGGTIVNSNRVAKFNLIAGVWSALGTGSGNGVNNTVFALTVRGSDVYVGGAFTAANVGGTIVSANRVAKFNTVAGVWSAFGTGIGNDVSDVVIALVVTGNDLYVGGQFTITNVDGTAVSMNNVAKFNTTVGVWSALGTGGGNGVNGPVFALAVSGSDLYVGGAFTTANLEGVINFSVLFSVVC